MSRVTSNLLNYQAAHDKYCTALKQKKKKKKNCTSVKKTSLHRKILLDACSPCRLHCDSKIANLFYGQYAVK